MSVTHTHILSYIWYSAFWGYQHDLGISTCFWDINIFWGSQHALGISTCSWDINIFWGYQHDLGISTYSEDINIFLWTYRVSQKNWDFNFAWYLENQVPDFQIVFFFWKLRSIWKFWVINNLFCAIFEAWDICKTKWDSWLHDSAKNWKYLV